MAGIAIGEVPRLHSRRARGREASLLVCPEAARLDRWSPLIAPSLQSFCRERLPNISVRRDGSFCHVRRSGTVSPSTPFGPAPLAAAPRSPAGSFPFARWLPELLAFGPLCRAFPFQRSSAVFPARALPRRDTELRSWPALPPFFGGPSPGLRRIVALLPR